MVPDMIATVSVFYRRIVMHRQLSRKSFSIRKTFAADSYDKFFPFLTIDQQYPDLSI